MNSACTIKNKSFVLPCNPTVWPKTLKPEPFCNFLHVFFFFLTNIWFSNLVAYTWIYSGFFTSALYRFLCKSTIKLPYT